jgi:hypothetical protein
VKPITPEEVKLATFNQGLIPEFVISAFNELIKENWKILQGEGVSSFSESLVIEKLLIEMKVRNLGGCI